MRSIRLPVILIECLVGVIAHPAQSQDIRINFIREDLYAERRMVVFKKPGEKMSGVVRIQSFDPVTNSFVMEGVAGESVSVPVSDIERIEFEQTVQRQSPQAQQSFWKIVAIPGSMQRYNVSKNALRVESGEIILPASSPMTIISTSSTTPVETSEPKKGVTVKTDKIIEARNLTYDVSTKSFRIEVQEVTYTREEFSASGVSGIRK
jgi:hypothetical protein